MESMLPGRRLWDSLFINRGYDEVWAIPQIAPSSLPFLHAAARGASCRSCGIRCS